MKQKRPPSQYENEPSFPDPGNDKGWALSANARLRNQAYGRPRGGVTAADIACTLSLPPVEVPPVLTRRQYLDIVETQPDP